MKLLSFLGAAFVALLSSVSPAAADDSCATFFWTGSNRAAVERYKPHYLIGEGLSDVNMGHIVGNRIRYKWSQQAATCFASTNSYGYFTHPDFARTTCTEGEECFPGTRGKKLSERLLDVKTVVETLNVPNADSTYQQSLITAKAASFQVIALMENAKSSTAAFYQNLAAQYQPLIDLLDMVLNVALPPALRIDVLDELCQEENVEEMEDLLESCLIQDSHCQLYELYDLINSCSGYQDGATLEQLIDALTDARADLAAGKAAHLAERDQLNLLWTQIQALQ
jgi:hypothetical protein